MFDCRYGQAALFQDASRKERIVLPGLSMAELGNQRIFKDAIGAEVPTKGVFELFGVRHVSFDINGRDGALAYDLSKPLPDKFYETFDVVTDFGCIEHVDGQYQAWRNVHNLCRKNGVMIHAIPEVGSWPGHCLHWYDAESLDNLAVGCGYTTVIMRRVEHSQPHRNLHAIACCFRKGRGEFIDQDTFAEIMTGGAE